MSAVVLLLRLAGRLLLAVSYEIEEALADRRVPDVIPEWLNEEVDLP